MKNNYHLGRYLCDDCQGVMWSKYKGFGICDSCGRRANCLIVDVPPQPKRRMTLRELEQLISEAESLAERFSQLIVGEPGRYD